MIGDHVAPSVEVNAVYVVPERWISRYWGAAPETPTMAVARAPCDVRYETAMPFDGVTNAP